MARRHHWENDLTATIRFIAATAATVFAASSPNGHAGDFDGVRQLSQDAFLRLSKDVASLTALPALSPGTTLDLLGVDIGIEAGVGKAQNESEWRRAGGGSTNVVSPRVTIHKGLLAGFDVGASLGLAGNTGMQTVGGILRYRLVESGALSPGVTLRLTGGREYGGSALTMRSLGADLTIAKPLVLITPYVGAGTVRTQVAAPGTALAGVTVNRTRTFLGFDARLALASLAVEVERIGEVTTMSGKIGFRF